MISIKSLSLILAIWLQFTVVTVVAHVAARSEPNCRPLTPRTNNGVCGTGIYHELSPILKGYPVAVDFCKKVFPVKCGPGKQRRGAASTTAATTPATTAAATTSKTTTKAEVTKSAWSKCQKQPPMVISTLCSCIQTTCQPTTTKKTTTKSTTPVITTPKTTTPVITTPVITTPVITTPVITTPVITTPTTTPSTTASTTALVPCQDCTGTGCPGCNAICRDGRCQFD